MFLMGSTLAQTPLDSLRHQRDTHLPDSARVLLTLDISEQLLTARNAKESIKEAQRAFSEATALNFTKGIGLALMQQGMIYFQESNFLEASKRLLNAMPYLEQTGTNEQIATLYNWTGNTFYRLSQYDKAFEYHLKSLRTKEQVNDLTGIGISYYNLGNIFFEQKQYEAALEYHEKSLAIKKKLKDARGIAFSYNSIANVYTDQQKLDQALNYYNAAKGIFDSLKFALGAAYTQGNIGKIFIKKKQYIKACEALLDATVVLERAGDKNGLIEANNLMGEVRLIQQQYAIAEKHLIEAEVLAMESGAEDKLIVNYLLRAKLDSARGDTQGAFDWFKKYHEKKESVFNTQRGKQLAELKASFDIERKDQEIALLNKEKALQENIRKNQQTTFAIIFVALLIIASGLLYFLTQKQKSNRNLAQQKQIADELNQLNHKLFSIISHDLRAPLNNLTGVIDLTSKEILTREDFANLLKTLRDNTQQVNNLLENLLNWSKAKLRGDLMKKETIAVCQLADGVIELMRPLAERKNITLMHESKERAFAYVDKNMIELVIRNLISNAIKFTPELGKISVLCERLEDTIRVSVRDTGVGIDNDLIEKLFSNEHFTTRGTANEHGTGLGLILCKDFIEKNNGQLIVSSAKDEGSIFSFSLPITA